MSTKKTEKPPLLPLIAQGDSQAVEEFISRYKGLVWWVARQLASPAEAEDAVQEIFVDLWSSAARFDVSKASESAFVTMIARRRLIDRRRKAGRRPSESSLDGLEMEPAKAGAETVEAIVEASLARQALSLLDEKERRAVTLSVFYGLSHSEISEKTQLPLGTVKTYVRRGLSRVRELLQPRRHLVEGGGS